jgi:hypothetical protein
MHKYTMTRPPTPARHRPMAAPRRQPATPIRRSAVRPPPRRAAWPQRCSAALERWFWRGAGQFWDGLAHKWLFLCVVGAAWILACWLLAALVAHAPVPGQVTPTPAATSVGHPQPVSSVPERVPALYQGDPSIGWDSPQQYQTWWPSACSAVALTADLRGWGTQVGVGIVLDHIWKLGAISMERGLTNANALAQVAELYGYQAQTFWHWGAQQVAQVTSQGVPVLVLLVDARQQTPYPAFVAGHWLVVVSSSASLVEVRDSSGYRIHTLTPALFHTLFTGVAVVVWRGALSLP